MVAIVTNSMLFVPVGEIYPPAIKPLVEEFTADDATCIYGLVIDPSLKDELMVTIVATGVNQKSPKLAIDNKPRASIKLSPVGLDKDLTLSLIHI